MGNFDNFVPAFQNRVGEKKKVDSHRVDNKQETTLSDLKSRSGKDTKEKPLSIRERSHYEMK